MTARISSEQQGRLIADYRVKRGFTQERLAELIGVDIGTIARWERGAQRIRSRNVAAVASALEIELGHLEGCIEPDNLDVVAEQSDRDLRIVEFVEWLAEASGRPFSVVYRAVVDRANGFEAEPGSLRHVRNHGRASVGRERLAAAVSDYYDPLNSSRSLYTAEVAGTELTLTVLAEPGWTGLNVNLQNGEEQASYVGSISPPQVAFSDAIFNAGVDRLADAEVNNSVMVNNPMYRLLSVEVGSNLLKPVFGLAKFADYSMRNGLMELELIDALTASKTQQLESDAHTPVRDGLLPTVDAATEFDSYFCTGGPVALFAVARPASDGHPADYAIFLQVRGKNVIDIPGKISTVPKGWHQPVGEARSQASLSMTLIRELEEELLGREDLEQISDGSKRAANPLHRELHSEAMRPLVDSPDKFQLRCSGFGLNLLSGTYEVPCLIVIEDENWWRNWGHRITGNWETTSIDSYSSQDTEGLAGLIHEPHWSNEGLFALLEGLQCLNKIGDNKRLAIPPINVLH